MTITTLVATGALHTYTVPAGVTYVTLECWGASGSTMGAAGGYGGYSKGQLIVAPGTVLNVYVGGSSGGAGAGWNGGGAGAGVYSGGGGGASDVRLGGTALSNRVIVAGGGGGSGYRSSTSIANGGGVGGSASGGGGAFYGAGGPGTQTGGYALGQGGTASGGAFPGGGGGGGYYGGFAGANNTTLGGGGGGGGSGYLSSSLVAGGTMTNGAHLGNGQVTITAVNNPPLAPTLTGPGNNGYIINTEANPFTWAYNNVDPGGYQSKADFQYKKFGDVSWTTLTNVATTAPTYTLPASTWTVGFQYEWQVKAYGAYGAASPWSASRFTNTIASVPAPTITTPTTGTLEYSTPVELDWTLPGAFTCDAYRVQRADLADGSGVIYYDTGTVVLADTSAMVPMDAAAGRTDWLRVQFRYNAHWSAWASVDILCEFGPPNIPTLTAVQVVGQPAVNIVITNPPAGGGYADTILNDLHRTGIDGVNIRIAANLPVNATFTDPLPGAGSIAYTVVAYAASGATATSI